MSQEALLDFFRSRLKKAAYPCYIEYGNGAESILSGMALWTASMHSRHAMRAAGMREGDVWLQESGGAEALIHFFACLQGHFIFCPKQIPREAQSNATARRVFCLSKDKKPQLLQLIALPAELSEPDGFALFLHTSGTSQGLPRTVRLEASMILHQIHCHLQVAKIEPESNRLMLLPWFHGFGWVLDHLLGLAAGQYLHQLPEPILHPRLLLETVERLEVDWLATVPRILQLLAIHIARNRGHEACLARLHIHSGGAYFAPDARTELAAQVRAFHWGYGLTECGPGVLWNGEALGCEVKLQEAPTGVGTMLWMRGPSLGRWEGCALEQEDGWFCTGDLASEVEPGRYEILGRGLDCFKTAAGTWVHLREIERNLEQHFQLTGVHIALHKEDAHFDVRLLSWNGNDPTVLERRLQKVLPLPARIWVGRSAPELWHKLVVIAQKSLNEALGRLPLDEFSRLI